MKMCKLMMTPLNLVPINVTKICLMSLIILELLTMLKSSLKPLKLLRHYLMESSQQYVNFIEPIDNFKFKLRLFRNTIQMDSEFPTGLSYSKEEADDFLDRVDDIN